MKNNRRSGTSILELVIGVCALMPLLLYGIDLLVISLAIPVVDSLAGNCARQASSGPPADLSSSHVERAIGALESPYLRALSSLRDLRVPTFIAVSHDLKMTESINEPLPTAPIGGPVRGAVSIELESIIALPCPLPFMSKQLTIKSRRTIPYTWTMPTRTIEK